MDPDLPGIQFRNGEIIGKYGLCLFKFEIVGNIDILLWCLGSGETVILRDKGGRNANLYRDFKSYLHVNQDSISKESKCNIHQLKFSHKREQISASWMPECRAKQNWTFLKDSLGLWHWRSKEVSCWVTDEIYLRYNRVSVRRDNFLRNSTK